MSPAATQDSDFSACPDPVPISATSGPSADNESSDEDGYEAAKATASFDDQAFGDAVTKKYQQLLSFEDAEREERVLSNALARRRQQLLCSAKKATPVQRRLYDLPRLGKTVRFATDDALERSAHPRGAPKNEAGIPEREPRPY